MDFHAGENVRIMTNCDHPAHGQCGNIIQIVTHGSKKANNVTVLLRVRLDDGYVPSETDLPETRYTTLIAPQYVSKCSDTTFRRYTTKNCSVCGRLCYSNKPGGILIAQDIKGKVICEKCTSTHYYDRVREMVVSFT